MTDGKTAALAAYFGATYIDGEFAPEFWSHFDNEGPRTTNLAEGWHNGLNTSLGVSHPSMSVFLDWLQRYQFQVQCRSTHLASGRPARERKSTYSKVDQDIASAKLQYGMLVGSIFSYQFPHPSAHVNFRDLTFYYLNRVSYLCLLYTSPSPRD